MSDRYTQDGIEGVVFHESTDQYQGWIKKNYPRVDKMRQAAVSGAKKMAKWVTIGGSEEGGKKHKGGTPVQIDENGVIQKGPKGFKGDHVSNPTKQEGDGQKKLQSRLKVRNEDYSIKEHLQGMAADSLYSRGEGWVKKLEDSHKSAIVDYTGDSYEKINNELISGELSPEVKKQVELINEAIDKAGPINVEVYKGINPTGELIHKLESGGVLEFKNLNSTSLDAGLAAGFSSAKTPTILVIKAKTGAYVDPVTQFENEQELLQKSGTRYRVTGKGVMGNVPKGQGVSRRLQNVHAYYLEEV